MCLIVFTLILNNKFFNKKNFIMETTQKKTLREAAIESGYVTAEEFDRWVDPSKMVGKIE